MNDRQFSELWLRNLLSEQGASPGTIETYRDDLSVYLRWLSEQELALLDVRYGHVVEYLQYLSGCGYLESSLHKKLAVVRTFHRFLVAADHSATDPTTLIDPMKRGKLLPHVISMRDVELLLETAHRAASDSSLSLFAQASYSRRAALLETLYATGLSVTEAVTLSCSALQSNCRMLHVKGKGGKDRLVPMHDGAVQAILRWQKAAEAYGVTSEKWVFHSVRDGSKPLTRQSSLTEIKRAAFDAGLENPERLSPHILRHAFATHLLSRGADLRDVQAMLGHQDLRTTAIYTRIIDRQPYDKVVALHPLMDDPAV